ncbi:TBC1 domain family member 14-like [Harmonia axyridis]|uniref:TBC1 domain family member 14-like n=1 Tax=Harmonia axyridis TaxID=115357 RepID=UPI001E275128|nr:TBC1 domain family member 14-like [Harmonia axyridis]
MKIEHYRKSNVLSDFVNTENESNVLVQDDIIEDNCVLQCSSHSSDQSMGQKTDCSSSEDAEVKSLPDSFKNTHNEGEISSLCDQYQNISCCCSTPYPLSDSWFKTWPEKCDKTRNNRMYLSNSCKKCESKNTQFNNFNKNGRKSPLNEAFENISFASNSQSTNLTNLSQSHIGKNLGTNNISSKDLNQNEQISTEIRSNECEQLKHIFTSEQLSNAVPTHCQFLSTNSSESDGRTPCTYDVNSGWTSKRKLTNFINRNILLGWKTDVPSSIGNVFKFFGSNNQEISSLSHPNVASSSALFQYSRPPNVPAKSLEEEEKHREEYKAILAAAKRKEAMHSANKKKQEKKQLQQEEGLANAAKYFAQKVLPNWEAMRDNKKTRELWWQGLPSNIRGKVWSLAIGNELNLTQQLYEICLARAKRKLKSPNKESNESPSNQERSLDAIKLDISRTFPHLCIFQEGGPYSEILHSLLAAYVCYRPDVGYVQGMSYVAAILILNLELNSAFICFANLLNQPLHLSAFTLNQNQMLAYFEAFHELFNYNLPKLFAHFQKSGLTPDLYLLDWIYTIFARAMPLDVACRIWDVFLRDGYEFIFRTALGILYLYQDTLMKMDFLDGAQFLTRLPDNISSENLFRSIQNISVNIGKTTFNQIVERQISLYKHKHES